tara:strand:+ start:3662 stop:4114 length:453 start_codon:yes stop_codon:yes gene_type:complete
METLHYSIQIDALVGIVYKTMLDPEGFKQWTLVFDPTSRYEGSWKKGSEIRFLSDEKNGSVCGILSHIRENIPNKIVSIEHQGQIIDGKEITTGKDVEAFAGCLEEYIFEANDDGTHLQIRTDSLAEWADYFNKTWPKALQQLKEICESN